MALFGTLVALRQWDQRRRSMPGEHWAAFGTGLALLQWGLRRRSPLLKVAACSAAPAVMVRGVSGRDGLIARLKAAPQPPAPSRGR